MLWSKRRSSRSDLYSTKSQPEQSLSCPSVSAHPSPRLPLSPLDPLDPQGSQSSLAADMSWSLDPSSSADPDTSLAKQFITRQTSNRDSSENKHSYHPQLDQTRRTSIPSLGTTLQTTTIDSSTQASDALNTDLYTFNSLNSFSFGSVPVQIASPPPHPVHPLSTTGYDADNASDDLLLAPDVTPRPSVVVYHDLNQSQNTVRSHPAQPPGPSVWPPLNQIITRGRHQVEVDQDHDGGDSDADSLHPTGTPSASDSATSLSSTSADFSRTTSRTSHTSTTNQTSTHDHSITDVESRRLRTANITSPSAESSGTSTDNNTAVEFSSDEDYGDSDYDYYDEDNGVNIEIGSAQFEGSVITHDWEHELYSYASGGSGSIKDQVGSGGAGRRGSLPMAIPGVTSSSDLKEMNRNREDSLATLRRPSRSLGDEFRNLGHNHIDSAKVEGHSNRPLPPVSVPGSDGDWKNLEVRNKIKGKTKEKDQNDPISPTSTSTSGTIVTKYQPSVVPPPSSIAMADFDLDWAQMRGGITSLDPRELGDIIGPKPSAHNRILAENDRRPSASGSRWLPTWGNDNARRPSTATVSSFYGDSFGKAVGKWGGDGYLAQRRDWSFRKEKTSRKDSFHGFSEGGPTRNSVSGFLTPRGSMMTERSGVTPVSIGDREKDQSKEEKDKVTKSSVVWKGMQLDTQEVWKNDLVGRFKVDRRATKPADPSKGPQQRLVVQHFRDSNTSIPIPPSGPPVTIHKHSKAVAFSISRHYRSRVMTNASRDASFIVPNRPSGRGNFLTPPRVTDASISGTTNGGAVVPPARKSTSMILLAPRRVQEAFTSTNTTRKLESHGLLDDGIAGSSSESRERERVRRHKEREKEKDKQKEREKQKEKERRRKPVEDTKNKGKEKQQAKDDSHIATSSGGSVTSGSTLISTPLPPPPASAPSSHTYPPNSTASLNSSTTNYVDRGVYRNASHNPRRRRRIRDPLDDDGDDDDDDEHAPPTRTPHSETYGTMDASVIEQLRPRQERSHIADYDSNASFLKRFIRGRSAHPIPGPPSGQFEPLYDPPWLTLASRNKQEQQQRVVDNLNSSFKDVGLLPSTHRDKSVPQKQKKIASGNNNAVDIFEDIPPESLYMLLPLWPGDTDPISEHKMGTTERPYIPGEKRQYLLVYYKLPPDIAEEERCKKSRGEGESKKRSRNSPTSSSEVNAKRDDRASILLSSFHISARLVSYRDLQGSGVRIPDEGLTVTGPLDAAFRTMPSAVREEGLYDWVLGMCHSREAGIEFYPDGLIKMGLCLQTSEPIEPLVSEEDQPPEPDVELTPIGKAVLEMAWLGALALTSFGSL